jgi:magnesium chelatase subunit D
MFRSNGSQVAVDATLRAAADSGFQAPDVCACPLSRRDIRREAPLGSPAARHLIPHGAIRFKQFSRKQGSLFIFAIDSSGSMAQNRIGQAKGAVLRLLRQSYINRDRVAIVTFRGTAAEIVLPSSRSMLGARRVLDSLSVGGGTPLPAGLACALGLAKCAQAKHGQIVLLLFTDGGANVSARANGAGDRAQRRQIIEKEVVYLGAELRKAGVSSILVDTQDGFRSDGGAKALAQALGARYTQMHSASRFSTEAKLD